MPAILRRSSTASRGHSNVRSTIESGRLLMPLAVGRMKHDCGLAQIQRRSERARSSPLTNVAPRNLFYLEQLSFRTLPCLHSGALGNSHQGHLALRSTWSC